ncbi:DBC1/CARP1-like protein [Tanacetum coccineum]
MGGAIARGDSGVSVSVGSSKGQGSLFHTIQIKPNRMGSIRFIREVARALREALCSSSLGSEILTGSNINTGSTSYDNTVKGVDLFPVASSTTFFTDMHHLLKIIAVGNLRSACDHRLRFLEEVVIFRDGQYLTLKEVFKSLDLTALYELNVDLFDVHADKRILNLNNMADGLVAGSLDLLTMLLKDGSSLMAIGGSWDTLDGNDPSLDKSSLLQTVLRMVLELTGLDLKNCRHWNPFLASEKDGRFSHKEVTVLYIPDLSDCLPSIDAWRDQWLSSKKAIAERERLKAG